MEFSDLINLGEAIAEKISVEKIYCLSPEDYSKHHLIIIIPASCGTKFTELEPFVRMATNANEDITYTFYQTGEIRAALKKGNLLFHIACIKDNLIYNKKDSPNLPESNSENLLAWKSEANDQFKDGIAKAGAFLDGANFYSEKNDAGLTVFMLHQFIELTFRTLELALLAKEKKTHSITVHQSLVIPLLPQLGLLFPDNTSEEKDILKTLNNAYSAVRYEQNHQVNEAFIPTLFHRAYLLQKRAVTIISELNNVLTLKIAEAERIEKVLKSNQTENHINQIEDISHQIKHQTKTTDLKSLPKTTEKSKLERIISIIIDHLDPDQIYVFGRKKIQVNNTHLFDIKESFENTDIHFDLLIISSVNSPYATNIQSITNSIDNITTNLLIHGKEEVYTRLESNDRFFNTAIKHGNLVYSKLNLFNNVSIGRIVKNENRNQTVANVTRRMYRSIAFLKAAELIKNDVFEVTISLLSQSMEQVCLGLIFNFTGYSPNLHSLSHLLNICRMFWPESEPSFPIQAPYDKKILSILNNSHSEIRYTVGRSIDPEDLEEAYSRCHAFIIQSEKMLLKTLSEQEIDDYEAVK